MVIDVVANPIQEETDIFSVENIRVIPESNNTILSILQFIAGFLIFILVIGIVVFYLII